MIAKPDQVLYTAPKHYIDNNTYEYECKYAK